MCGGTVAEGGLWTGAEGLSPRVRGNPGLNSDLAGETRSIPACAGEPTNLETLRDRLKVYPRVCGGTQLADSIAHHLKGLSPRVRGNQLFEITVDGTRGSIPACAGEPLL